MWIKRKISDILNNAAQSRPVVVITGARQTGKSSLLNHCFPEYRYVSLDLPSEAEWAEQEPENFLKRYPPPVCIDEIQHAPQLFRHIKIQVDAHRSLNGQFILSGSQKFPLMKEVADSLAGRAEIIELEGLAYSEINTLSPLHVSPYSEAMLRGGFPELHSKPDLDAYRFYRSYILTYLERDVRQLLNIHRLRDFERFLRICALRSGQMLNRSDMARDVGISPTTANEWISVLQASNFIFLLEPWFSNGSKSIAKSPKLYLADTGLLCYLIDCQTPTQLEDNPHIGAIWETFVFAQLRKEQSFKNGSWSLFYWRDRSKEVDFLTHQSGYFNLMECKWTEKPDARMSENLQTAAHAIGEEYVKNKSIIARNKETFPLNNGIKCLSLTDVDKF